MKCEIARDLLTLYAEDLCSPETSTELEAHLATCEECSKKLVDYKKEIDAKLTATDTLPSEAPDTLKPLKKVRKKLKYRKWLSIVLAVILIILLGIIGYLSYGQITNRDISFSSLVDIYKLNKVTKAYAEGDSQPLIDTLSFTFAEIYALESTTDYESFDEYKTYLKNKLDIIYEKELKGKKVRIELDDVYCDPYEEMYSIDTPVSAYCYSFYDENDNHILSMDFSKLGPNKYNLSDYSTFREGNVFNEEFVNYLLPTENVLTNMLLPYAARNTYNARQNGDTEANPSRYFATHIRYYNDITDAEKSGIYKTALEEKIVDLYTEGLYFTDVLFSVYTFDKDTGHWIYKVMFEVENQNNNETCTMECYFRYYDNRLYVIPEETPTIIGSDVLTDEQANKLITLFDL